MIGLTIAVATALVSEMTRSAFRTRAEVEAETGLRLLATLPSVPGNDMRQIVTGLRANSNTLFGERIRQLRTFLFMRNNGFDKRVIMVTSSRPGEGKSLTTMALAEMAALAGKSVIVVDGDLRRSTLAKSFRWTPDFDMADFALEVCDLRDAIHTDHALGIDVRATVHHSTDAADELNSDWLKPMVEELKRAYDVVIIDSPPLLEVADGLVLARAVDSIVYVVRWDVTPRQAVADGLDALSVMRGNVAGIVLNQADPRVAESAYGDSYAKYTQ
jgi:capsular exopolysaccharide synthesis family protein